MRGSSSTDVLSSHSAVDLRNSSTGVALGATRAPTSAAAFIEESYLARVVADVARNPALRRELNARVPPIILEAAEAALRRTPVGKAFDAAWKLYGKVRPR